MVLCKTLNLALHGEGKNLSLYLSGALKKKKMKFHVTSTVGNQAEYNRNVSK